MLEEIPELIKGIARVSFYSIQIPQRRALVCAGVDSAQPDLKSSLISGSVLRSYQFLAFLIGHVTTSLFVYILYSHLPAY